MHGSLHLACFVSRSFALPVDLVACGKIASMLYQPSEPCLHFAFGVVVFRGRSGEHEFRCRLLYSFSHHARPTG